MVFYHTLLLLIVPFHHCPRASMFDKRLLSLSKYTNRLSKGHFTKPVASTGSATEWAKRSDRVSKIALGGLHFNTASAMIQLL
jgi:hypothetical protein